MMHSRETRRTFSHSRWLLTAGFLLLVFLAVGCGPAIVIENKTKIPIRVAIFPAGAKMETFSPSPGESSSMEVRAGAYTAVVIPDLSWREDADALNRYLTEHLAHPEQLSSQQIADLRKQLSALKDKMKSYEQTGGKGTACSGSVTDESGAGVEINQGADGQLTIVCK